MFYYFTHKESNSIALDSLGDPGLRNNTKKKKKHKLFAYKPTVRLGTVVLLVEDAVCVTKDCLWKYFSLQKWNAMLAVAEYLLVKLYFMVLFNFIRFYLQCRRRGDARNQCNCQGSRGFFAMRGLAISLNLIWHIEKYYRSCHQRPRTNFTRTGFRKIGRRRCSLKTRKCP